MTQALHEIKGQGPTLGPPKTESAIRSVPVAESIAARLAAHIDEYVEDAEPGTLVFTSLREVMSIMGHASSAAGLRYLKTAEHRSRREIADAIGRRIES